MVRDDEEWTLSRQALASLDHEPAGRFIDDPSCPAAHSGLADGVVVRDEASGDMMRDGPDEPAQDFDAQTSWPANKRLGALTGDDLRDLTVLGYD